MASGWKDHRGRNGKNPSTHLPGMHGPGNGVSGSNHTTADGDRNDVPQRPPTVGQELPNNLDWPMDAQSRSARNRKRGNLDKNREKKLDTSGDGRSSDGVPAAIWPPPQSHQLLERAKQVPMACDAESTSDGDASSCCAPNQGARPKKDLTRKMGRPPFQSENEISQSKMTVKKTNRLNTNQVAGKLGQIRDYIKQVTDTVDDLQKAGDASAMEQMEKLYHFRADLQDYEHRLCEILQGVPGNPIQIDGLNSDAASLGSVHSSPFANIDCTSEGSADGSAISPDIEEGFVFEEDDGEPSVRSNEHLRQVAESQEKLKALQEQNAVMLGLQHRAESRLVQAKSFHDHLLSKSVEKGGFDPRRLTLDELGASHALCDDLNNIEHRLALLREVYDNRDRAESLCRSGDGGCRTTASLSASESQRRELQDKLIDLQHKKRQMDAVLQELCFLRESRVQDELITSATKTNKGAHDAAAVQKQPKQSVTQSKKDETSGRPVSLRDVDPTNKTIKLDEMKSWLQTLQGMVFSHQPSQNALNVPTSLSQPRETCSGKSTFDSLNRGPVSLPLKSRKSKKPKTNNIAREQSNDCVMRLPSNWMGHEQSDRIADDNDGDDTLDENDSELNKKICRLHAAKNKLEKLQDFLSVAQQVDQRLNQQLAGEYVEEQMNALDGGSSAYNLMRGSKASPSSLSSSSKSRDKRQPESTSRSDRSRSLTTTVTANNAQMVTSSLSGNVRRLPLDDASWSNPGTSASTNARRNSNVQVHATSSGRSSRTTPTQPPPSQPPPPSLSTSSNRQQQISNHELWAEMRHQIALQDELRHWELESLMHKSAGHKNYLLNQDNRSENMSASAKSELHMGNASTGATDGTTTATWGGSSLDNGARDTIDGNDDSGQEEPTRRPNGEECSSDEGVEVDNSVLTTTPQLDPHQSKAHNSTSVNVQLDSASASAWRPSDETRNMTHTASAIGDSLSQLNGAANVRTSRAGRHVAPDRNYLKVPTNHCGGAGLDFRVHENRTSAEDSYHYQIPPAQSPNAWPQPPGTAQLRHQIESVMLLCQSLLNEQHAETTSHLNSAERPSPLTASNVPDMLQMQHGQMVVQQLLLGLSHCYHLLYLQQVEMQRIQQVLHSSVSTDVSCSSDGWQADPRVQPSNPERPVYSNVDMGSSRWHREDPTSMAMSSVSSSSSQLPPPPPPPPLALQHHQHHFGEPNLFMPPASSAPPPPAPLPPPPPPAHPIPNIPQYHQTNTETLNNQVPPGNRANNYWDNFRSYSRQNLLSTSSSVSQPNKSNDYVEGHSMTFPRASTSSSSAARNIRMRKQSAFNDGARPAEPVRPREEQPVFLSSFAPRDAMFGLPVRENNRLGLSPQRLSHDLQKDKNISGLAVSHNVVKNHGNLSPNAMSAAGNESSPSLHPSLHLASPSKVSPKTAAINSNSNTAAKESSYRVMSDAKDSTRQHAVEDSVYSEVVSLVSRFNSEPQHLVQLLREMHKLNDAHAMRRALRALRDVSLTSNDVAETLTPPPPPPQNQPPCNSTRSGNVAALPMRNVRAFYGGTSTSSDEDDNDDDDDEVRAHFVKPKKTSRYQPFMSRSAYELNPYSLGRFGTQPPLASNVPPTAFGVTTGFDLSSTSHSTQRENLFMSSSDTGVDVVSKQPSRPPRGFSPNPVLHENSTSEGGASSSAQDRESETSMDASQLEKQMKGIMVSVTSFVASFARQTCTPKTVSSISSHIMALVLPLVQNLNHDVQSFPAGQFACIIENTLSKYVGKRISDCRESLFSDVSDVLFNELGFFQVMMSADGHEVKKLSYQSCANPKSNTIGGLASNEGRHVEDRRSTTNCMSPLPLQSSNVAGVQLRTDATDADLVVMARRGGDDDGIDKMHEEFSCDIPDVCVGRSSIASSSFAAASANVDVSVFSRASPSTLDSLLHSDPQPNYPASLPEFSVRCSEAAAAEGHLEDQCYFDREVEIETEEMGDTQDLAEADQSQNYSEAESALNDVCMQDSNGDGFHHPQAAQAVAASSSSSYWGIDGLLANGNIDRAEDDRHIEEEFGGCVGGGGAGAVANAATVEIQGELEKSGPELGLDEVPIKLRDLRSTRPFAVGLPDQLQDEQQPTQQQRGDKSAKKSDRGVKS